MTPPKPSQRDLARAAMSVAQRGRFGGEAKGVWTFQHITQQDALFRSIGSRPRAGILASANPSWHSSGNSNGLLVDIGAVRPLTGQAFVDSQVRDMEAQGFKAIWSAMPKLEYMRGVGKGTQTAIRRVKFVFWSIA